MSLPLGAEKLRIEGCSMIEGVKIEIRRKREDFFFEEIRYEDD